MRHVELRGRGCGIHLQAQPFVHHATAGQCLCDCECGARRLSATLLVSRHRLFVVLCRPVELYLWGAESRSSLVVQVVLQEELTGYGELQREGQIVRRRFAAREPA